MAKTGRGITRRNLVQGAAIGIATCSAANSIPACAEEATDAKIEARKAVAQLNPQNFDFTGDSGDGMATLFSEIKIGGLTLPNRMVKSAAGSDTAGRGSDSEGNPQPMANPEELISYYRNLAKGGVGLVWMEDVAQANMFEHFPRKGYQIVENIPFETIVNEVHAAGAYIGYQISCMGVQFSGTDLGNSFGASSVAGDMTREELENLIADYINAAVMLKGYGFDGIEINAAGNNIGQSFLSRQRNHRDDEYGPTCIEDRARFITDIVAGIKQACGEDFVVQVLFNCVEENDTDLGDSSLMTTLEENLAFAKLFEAAGVNSLHLRLGPLNQHPAQFASDLFFVGRGIDGTTGYGTQYDFSCHFGGHLRAENSGYGLLLDIAEKFKQVVSIPVGTVTCNDPAYAPDLFEGALRDGKVDFLLMNRPLTVDFDYVNKLRAGALEDIAPCTRCLHCYHDKNAEGKKYEHCRVNACTQRAFRADMPEGYELLPIDEPKKILVVGAGPAGLEAAAIAAQRGHEVTVYEKEERLGGLLDCATLVKGPHECLPNLKAYLAHRAEKSGAAIVTGTEVDASLIEEVAPDAVIIAAGGVRQPLGFEQTEGTRIVAPEGILAATDCKHAVISGCSAQALDCAMYLMEQGVAVSMVFPDDLDQLGRGHSDWVKTFEKPILFARGLRAIPHSAITEVNDGSVTVAGAAGVDFEVPCDVLVEGCDMVANSELAHALDNLGIDVHVVGDAMSPFNIAEAIFEANRVARNI